MNYLSKKMLYIIQTGMRRRTEDSDQGSREGSGGRWLARREEASRRAVARLVQSGAGSDQRDGGVGDDALRSGGHGGRPGGFSAGGSSSLENISAFLRAAPPPGRVSGENFTMSAQDQAERRLRAEEALFLLLEEEEMEVAVAKEEARLNASLGHAEEEGCHSGGGPGGGPGSDAALDRASAGEEFTVRSLVVGSVVGGFLSLMNIYMGFKLTIWQPVGLPATIIGFALMRSAVQVRTGRCLLMTVVSCTALSPHKAAGTEEPDKQGSALHRAHSIMSFPARAVAHLFFLA